MFLQANDTAQTKAQLQTVLDETAARLLRPKSTDHAKLISPLSISGGVPWLPLHNHIFTGMTDFA